VLFVWFVFSHLNSAHAQSGAGYGRVLDAAKNSSKGDVSIRVSAVLRRQIEEDFEKHLASTWLRLQRRFRVSLLQKQTLSDLS
jgi:hypothetical protein